MRKRPTLAGEPVTMGELRSFVLLRDGICLASTFFGPTHQCAGQWGNEHRPTEIAKLTLEHVPSVHRPSDLRRDDEAHCVTLCHKVNVGGPPQMLREWLRTYLQERYPDCTKERR